jgi:uncharacterized alpha-E superfamily protein
MLSRIAESLFWIGRYTERADDTGRILDIYVQQILEDASAEASACRTLFEVMGRPADGEVGVRDVLAELAYDRQATSSITGALAAARLNARSARDSVSSELWETLNLTYLELTEQRRRAERVGAHRFFQWVRERTALASGIADSTMSRDEGWLFLDLGRSIERVDMTARLLTTRAAGGSAGPATPSWTTLLRSCGANEAYLKTYRGRVSNHTAAEFLLLDRLFPRSMFFALSRAEECISLLDRGDEGRVGTGDAARRFLGRARNAMEFRGVDDMLPDLPGFLESVQAACARATNALGSKYFPHAVIEWVGEGA